MPGYKLQVKLASYDCSTNQGWLAADLECQIDGEPWCMKHQLVAERELRRDALLALEELDPEGWDDERRQVLSNPANVALLKEEAKS